MTGDVDLEQVILGSLLIDPEGCRNLASDLQIKDFSIPEHQALIEAIFTATEAGDLPHPSRIAASISELTFAGLTASQYIGRLLTVSTAPKLARDHIKQLKELSARRLMVEISHHLQTVASSSAPIGAGLAEAMRGIDTVQASMRSGRQSMVGHARAAHAVVDLLEKGDKPDIIKVGLADLDKYLGGLHRGELTIMAGRPSMGKSAAMFSASRLGAMQGTSSMIFSLEMRREAVMQRMLSDATWARNARIEYQNIARQNVTPYDLESLREAARLMETHAPLIIDDQAALTVAEIAARARRTAEALDRQGKKLDVLWIDHLGKIAASDRYKGNKVHETGEKTAALAALCRELDVAIVAAHQLNRGVESRDEKRPNLGDLRDSGDVEQDADTVIFLYRAAYYLERARYDDPGDEADRLALLAAKLHDLEWIIAKNRNGPCMTIETYVDMGCNVVRNKMN